MKTIHKYPIKADEFQRISLPSNADILSIQEQAGEIFLWALVEIDDPYIEHISRLICLHTTGQAIQHNYQLKHISTLLLSGGLLVLHFFEGIENAPD